MKICPVSGKFQDACAHCSESKYGTKFQETEALLASQQEDHVYLSEVLSKMSNEELKDLLKTSQNFVQAVIVVLRSRPNVRLDWVRRGPREEY